MRMDSGQAGTAGADTPSGTLGNVFGALLNIYSEGRRGKSPFGVAS